MADNKDLVRLLKQFLQGLRNHTRPHTRPLFHWIRLAAIETGFVALGADHHLIAATTKRQVQVIILFRGFFPNHI
ncbi:Uncharacterised protein [Mycobacteroides abscessus subsp. abscessus]|nr:Uncharacterised protein [Mycobacteroides abscessus subsp. abscessus]